jgi:redox-sensing transcriptional repressor
MNYNKNCIIRLSHYRNAINRFKQLGFSKVFSDNLADAIGVTPAQVRKDFSLFKLSGNKRGGYELDSLKENLNIILGKNDVQRCVLCGAGKLGTALMKYKGFEKEGIKIIAAFDTDTAKLDSKSEIKVLPIENLNDFLTKEKVKIGIIAVPEHEAQPIADRMVNSGIKGILNFAPIKLRCPNDVVINNVNLALELENVIYFVNFNEKAVQNGEKDVI